MEYKVSSTEKLRKKSSDFETKSLLYLMSFMDDSDEIFYYVVDFFNDVTGMDVYSNKLWDVQSKGINNMSAKEVGKCLVTLFKNYISEFEFSHYILFIAGISNSVTKNNEKNIFGIDNITTESIVKIKEGLTEEGYKKEYINNATLTKDNINSFLENITIVVDNLPNIEYVRAIINDYPNIKTNDQVLLSIFNEIKKSQSSKKEESNIEGVVIYHPEEALNYNRYITNNEIKMLTVQRIINRNPLSDGIPYSFNDIYNSWPEESRIDMLEECKQSLCRILFNNNASNGFWKIFELIFSIVEKNNSISVNDVFEIIKKDKLDIWKQCPNFDVLSLKYFISVIKDGLRK